MIVRRAELAEVVNWDRLVLQNPDHGQILQTKAWGEFKSRHGWQPLHYISDAGRTKVAMLVLERWVSSRDRIWYLPKGPGIASEKPFGAIARELAKNCPAFVIKFEPELESQQVDPTRLRSLGLRPASTSVQVSSATIIVNLTPEDEALMAMFKQKTRYNIRLSARKGVVVKPVEPTDSKLEQMWQLYAATSQRAGFFLRPKDYFLDYWRLQTAAGQAQLFFAYLGEQVLAAAFVTYLGAKAWYKDGGSTRKHSEFMAPYLLQWEIMRWLKARGVTSYDLVAVPRKAELNPKHPYYGLYQFKSGFHPDITEYIGTWDLPVKPEKYWRWQVYGERLLNRRYRTQYHDLFY